MNRLIANATLAEGFNRPIKGPKLLVSYEDITGKRKNLEYETLFKTLSHTLIDGKQQLEAKLELISSPTRIQLILKRVRKSYVAFKNQIK